MKKILELTHTTKNWKLELELADYPNILKRGICWADCAKIRGDKSDKNLILAIKILANNWGRKNSKRFSYKCQRCADYYLAIMAKLAKVSNPQDLADIKQELKKYESN